MAAGRAGNKARPIGRRVDGTGTGLGTVQVNTGPKKEASRAVLLPCGYLICPRCLGTRVVPTRGSASMRCPAKPKCTENLRSRHKCGHIVSHLLPGSSDVEGLAGLPQFCQPSDEDASRTCWKCQNLVLVVQIGDDKRELPFGAKIPTSSCPPETPVTVSYYNRRDVNSAAALMTIASLWYGGMGSVLAAGIVDRPSRIVILEGRPYSEMAEWRVLRTGFLARRQQTVARAER